MQFKTTLIFVFCSSCAVVSCQTYSTTPPPVGTIPYSENASQVYNITALNSSVQTTCRNTPLHDAVRKGDAKILRRLILMGEDMYIYDCFGLTPMDIAIEKNDIKIMITFIHYKYDVNSRSPTGNTALHVAASRGTEDSVTLLIRSGSDVGAVNNRNLTPLFLAVLNEKTEIFHTLAVFGASVNKTLECNENYIHSAARYGSASVALFLADLNVPVDRLNCKGETPLLIAVLEDNIYMINVLLSQGADYYRTFVDRQTYLHIAVKNGKKNALRTLATHGVLLDTLDLNSDTPLSLAIKQGDDELTRLLLERGPLLSLRVSRGTTYLHLAVDKENLPLLKVLLASGASPALTNSSGETAMKLAADKDYIQGLAVLKDFGGDVFQRYNYDSRTLLHAASSSGSLKSIKWLVAEGISPNITDRNQWTPLHIAAFNDHIAAAQLLLDLGACVNCRTNVRKTPYGLAKQYNFANMTKLLAGVGGVE